MKSLVIILFIIGLLFIFVGYYNKQKNCPNPKIEYRYIPRSFYEEQITSSDLKNHYSEMFDKQSIWSSYPFNTSITNFNNKNYDNFVEKE
jgi:hypothetical protein